MVTLIVILSVVLIANADWAGTSEQVRRCRDLSVLEARGQLATVGSCEE